MEEKTSSKLKSMLDSKKIRNIIIVVGLIGIGLIFLSNWVDFGSLTSGKGDEAFSVKTYSTKIENDLQTVISKIELWLSVSPMQSQKRLIFQQQKYVLQNYQNKGRE